MASTGIIQRRYLKHELIANPPLVGEIVFALDTEEFGTLINNKIVWKKFDDLVKSVNGQTGAVSISKEDLGLGNVDNTSDLNKPISTATLTLIDSHTSNTNNPHNVTKEQVGLGNVDNTSDLDKPLSTAARTALNATLGKNETAIDSERLGGFLPAYYINIDNSYSKTELDNILNFKANLSNVYTKIVLDSMLKEKANILDVYSKIESDTISKSFEKIANKGKASGYAGLDDTGKVPLTQLPATVTGKYIYIAKSSVDFPNPGNADVLYVDSTSRRIYQYDGTNKTYFSISTSIGITKETAFRGDYGQLSYEHISKTDNPHKVTAQQIGLGNVNNTSDLNKPISTATQTALDTQKTALDTQKTALDTHEADYNNPHNVTAQEVNAYTKTEVDNITGNLVDNQTLINYMDSSVWEHSVDLASDVDVDIATGGLIIVDGVKTRNGTRVLLTNQTNQIENGIYEASTGKWTRAANFDNPSNVTFGSVIYVYQGTSYANIAFILADENKQSVAQIDTVTILKAVNGNVYTVSIDGKAYSYTAGSSSTLATIANGLAALIPNGVSDGVQKITITADKAGVPITVTTTGTVPADISVAVTTPNYTNVPNIPVDSVPLIFKQYTGIDNNTAGLGLERTNQQLSVKLDGTSLTNTSTGLKVTDTTIRNDINALKYTLESTTASKTFTIKHNLNDPFVMVSIWIKQSDGTYKNGTPTIALTDNNTVDVTLATSANIRAVVLSTKNI